MADIYPYMERIRERFSDPSVADDFKDFTKTLLFEFSDTKQTMALTIVDGNASLEEKSVENPDVRLTTSTDTLVGIMDKKVNPMMAYMTRKIKVQGNQADLMQLQKLML